ncbi:ty3-gypsy retrotransposon protein [Tanacetum coccineum]
MVPLSIRVGRIIGVFIVQLEALRVELQATKGMLQARHGGKGDQGSLLQRSMRLDVPKFTGVDPDCWLFSINEYFSLLNTLFDQRLRIVGFNLEGAAAEWFGLMTQNEFITDWDKFEESVKNRFGPLKYEDPRGALSKLLQTNTVAEYQSEFEKLMNRDMDISKTLLISFYISRLKLSLQRELLVSKPTTLGDAYSLAHVTEARLDDQSMAFVIPKAVGTNGGSQYQRATSVVKTPLLPTPPKAIINPNVDTGVISVLTWFRYFNGYKIGGKVTHDYAQQLMEFTLLETTYTLKGNESLRMKKISLQRMQVLLEMEDVYGVYEYHGFALRDKSDHVTSIVSTSLGQPELELLLARFDALF